MHCTFSVIGKPNTNTGHLYISLDHGGKKTVELIWIVHVHVWVFSSMLMNASVLQDSAGYF